MEKLTIFLIKGVSFQPYKMERTSQFSRKLFFFLSFSSLISVWHDSHQFHCNTVTQVQNIGSCGWLEMDHIMGPFKVGREIALYLSKWLDLDSATLQFFLLMQVFHLDNGTMHMNTPYDV